MDTKQTQPRQPNHKPNKPPFKKHLPPRQANQQMVKAASNEVIFLPLGGIEDVTKNMYLYIVGDEILIVDCGLGFADETMLGVDLLLPDITPLLKMISPEGGKRIVGMLLTHGHEDHIGALPFVLPQLPEIPIFASPLTAAFANEKLKEFKIPTLVKTVQFAKPTVQLGSFEATFICITHSVPDSANFFIKTPLGNLFHASDYKIDFTPSDGQKTEYHKITKVAGEGVMCLMSDCLGSERSGFTLTDKGLEANFEQVMREVNGKVLLTTYSSNISRINQVVRAAEHLGRRVCFVGRSLIKAKTVAEKLGYLKMQKGTEVGLDRVRTIDDRKLLLLVAGSQGQENSALTRIANDIHNDVRLAPNDVVIFSSDAIPGNEIMVGDLIDSISRRGARALMSRVNGEFHVSGHGSAGDIMLMMSLVGATNICPISGTFTHMVAFRDLAKDIGYRKDQIPLLENGQELLISKQGLRFGQKHIIRNVFVDEISGEEVESFVLRDREKLGKEGVVIILAEVDSESGTLSGEPDVVARGFSPKDREFLQQNIGKIINDVLAKHQKRGKSWVHARKIIEETMSKYIQQSLNRRPLVLPVVIEV